MMNNSRKGNLSHHAEVRKSRGTKFFSYVELTYRSEEQIKHWDDVFQNNRARLKQQ